MTLTAHIVHRFAELNIDAAFEVPAGVTALFGRSGAGKSTIVNAIAGLFRPDQAQISLQGDILSDAQRHVAPHNRGMGYVFQDARLFPHMSVGQNLDYGTRFARRAPIASRDEVVSLLGLETLLERRPGTLSGGERQRVAIGRALLAAPRMLLMDEPLASLDAPRKADILPYIEALKARVSLPVLYVSHDMDEIARLADRLIVLRDGRIAAQGPIFDVLSDPGAIPHLGVREAGAILTATVEQHGEDGLSRLSTGAGPLNLPGVAAPEGTGLRIRILAQDVILSLGRPEGLSALNVLDVTVTSIHDGHGPGAAVVLDAGGQRLLARVTSRTVPRMGLVPGLKCYAIVKAMAVAPAAIGRASTGQASSGPDSSGRASSGRAGPRA